MNGLADVARVELGGQGYGSFSRLNGQPSAGVGMVTAMVSTLTGIAVRKDVAMTGEVTLRGGQFVAEMRGITSRLQQVIGGPKQFDNFPNDPAILTRSSEARHKLISLRR